MLRKKIFIFLSGSFLASSLYGASPKVETSREEIAAFTSAIFYENLEEAKKLIKNGFSLKRNIWTVCYASENNKEQSFRFLVEQGAPLAREDKSSFCTGRVSPMQYAAHLGDLSLAAKILEVSDVNEKGGLFLRTPLQEAVLSSTPEMVVYLLGEGANPNEVTKGGENILHLAALNQNPKVAKVLLDKVDGDLLNQNSKKEKGYVDNGKYHASPLIYALEHKNFETFEAFFVGGVKNGINQKNAKESFEKFLTAIEGGEHLHQETLEAAQSMGLSL